MMSMNKKNKCSLYRYITTLLENPVTMPSLVPSTFSSPGVTSSKKFYKDDSKKCLSSLISHLDNSAFLFFTLY